MSIPLVQNNEKDSINTSIIAIKRNIERINMLLGLVDSGSPDLSGLATKQELQDAVTDLQPVNEVAVDNMHSVTSGAVYSELVDGDSWHYGNTETISGNMWYKIVGKTVFLRINISNNELSFPSSGGDMIYTASGNTVYLPSAIRPQRSTNFLLCDNFTDSAIHARLQTNGAIRAWSSPTTDIRNVSSWQCDYCYRLD